MNKGFYKIISMMSGTSLDGVDACLVDVSENYDFKILGSYSLRYPNELRDALLSAANGNANTADICSLNFIVGECFAKCADELMKKYNVSAKDVDFISSHGQTIFHIPNKVNVAGFDVASTLQIGDISVIAEKTGIMTIGDFRTKDMAAGGQGAPLVPFADKILFNDGKKHAIQNIGGISNVTVVSLDCDIFAFDNTVGNMLIDYFSQKLFGEEYDKDGNFATEGSVDENWLDKLMSDDYLNVKPPKTTGREHFNQQYAEEVYKFAPQNKNDVLRTITEFTAKSIYDSYEKFVFPKTDIDDVVIGGGGAYNKVLMKSLQNYFGSIPVKTHEDYGISNKLKECLAFAFLGLATFLKRPNNVPACTGASRNVVMGKIAYPD